MALIKPYDDPSLDPASQDLIDNTISEAIELASESPIGSFNPNQNSNPNGFNNPASLPSGKGKAITKLEKAQKAFGKYASLDEIALHVAQILKNGETDAQRLSAARLSLEVHGIIRELENNKTVQVPSVNITVVQTHSQSDGNKNLFSILVPNE